MTRRWKIVRTDRELECPMIDSVLREKGAELVLLPDGISEGELLEHTRDADLILMCYTPITARIINAATRLKAIVKYGVGIDAIDIEAAVVRGVAVVNVPEYAEETVAEGAFMLMIALAKRLRPIHEAMQGQGWVWPGGRWLASDIAEKTVGLVGVGRIGKSMARMAGAGFRAHVLGYDPNVQAAEMAASGVEKCDDLEAMLGRCDFVSLHAVLNAQTRHLFSGRQFAAMKSSAFLINVSRGALVDESALLDALATGQIAGAGLDVYGIEPINRENHPLRALYGMDNVLLMPHLTFFTHEAMARLELETLERCFEALEGRPVLIKSGDPRLAGQKNGVRFAGSAQGNRAEDTGTKDDLAISSPQETSQ
ncbi:MAG: NAD(P)-dependent oxidoreductase [Rhizobiaceae bacterium]